MTKVSWYNRITQKEGKVMEYDERVAQEWGSLYINAYLESTKYVCSCIDKMECNCQEGEDE